MQAAQAPVDRSLGNFIVMKKPVLILFALLINSYSAYSQKHQSIEITNYSFQVFSKPNNYSFPVTIILNPGLRYTRTTLIKNNTRLIIGLGISTLPNISQFSILGTDTNFLPEAKLNGKNRAGYFNDVGTALVTVPIGMRYSLSNDNIHQIGITLLTSSTLPAMAFGGFGQRGKSTGPNPNIILSSFNQTYDYRPDGLLAFRLQAEYLYNWQLFGQSLFAAARTDVQLNNIPEVQFEVYNHTNTLVAAFKQTFPRFYFSMSLGWSFGQSKR